MSFYYPNMSSQEAALILPLCTGHIVRALSRWDLFNCLSLDTFLPSTHLSHDAPRFDKSSRTPLPSLSRQHVALQTATDGLSLDRHSHIDHYRIAQNFSHTHTRAHTYTHTRVRT